MLLRSWDHCMLAYLMSYGQLNPSELSSFQTFLLKCYLYLRHSFTLSSLLASYQNLYNADSFVDHKVWKVGSSIYYLIVAHWDIMLSLIYLTGKRWEPWQRTECFRCLLLHFVLCFLVPILMQHAAHLWCSQFYISSHKTPTCWRVFCLAKVQANLQCPYYVFHYVSMLTFSFV